MIKVGPMEIIGSLGKACQGSKKKKVGDEFTSSRIFGRYVGQARTQV